MTVDTIDQDTGARAVTGVLFFRNVYVPSAAKPIGNCHTTDGLNLRDGAGSRWDEVGWTELANYRDYPAFETFGSLFRSTCQLDPKVPWFYTKIEANYRQGRREGCTMWVASESRLQETFKPFSEPRQFR